MLSFTSVDSLNGLGLTHLTSKVHTHGSARNLKSQDMAFHENDIQQDSTTPSNEQSPEGTEACIAMNLSDADKMEYLSESEDENSLFIGTRRKDFLPHVEPATDLDVAIQEDEPAVGRVPAMRSSQPLLVATDSGQPRCDPDVQKDEKTRKWTCYEYHEHYLRPDSPLMVPCVSDKVSQAVSPVMAQDSCKREHSLAEESEARKKARRGSSGQLREAVRHRAGHHQPQSKIHGASKDLCATALSSAQLNDRVTSGATTDTNALELFRRRRWERGKGLAAPKSNLTPPATRADMISFRTPYSYEACSMTVKTNDNAAKTRDQLRTILATGGTPCEDRKLENSTISQPRTDLLQGPDGNPPVVNGLPIGFSNTVDNDANEKSARNAQDGLKSGDRKCSGQFKPRPSFGGKTMPKDFTVFSPEALVTDEDEDEEGKEMTKLEDGTEDEHVAGASGTQLHRPVIGGKRLPWSNKQNSPIVATASGSVRDHDFADHVYFIYRVIRREWSRDITLNRQQEESIDEIEFIECGPIFEDLTQANRAASEELFRRYAYSLIDPQAKNRGRLKTSLEQQEDEAGMLASVFKNHQGIIETRVARSLRTLNHGIPPVSKAHWMSRRCWVVHHRTTATMASISDDLFGEGETATSRVVEVLPKAEVFTALEIANDAALNLFVELKHARPVTANLSQWSMAKQQTKRDLEISMDLEEDAFVQEFEIEKGSSKRKEEVWVQEATLRGPRN